MDTQVSSLRSRIFKSSGANVLGIIARIAQQLLVVPIFLTAWSPQLYGEWLLVSAIPTYIALSDFGFMAAGSNELARRASLEDKGSVQRFYDRYTVYFQRWSLALALALAFVSYLLPFREIMGLQLMTQSDASSVFLLLTLAALVAQNSLSLIAGMRIMGKFHVGLLIRGGAALAQIAITFGLVQIFRAGPVAVAASILCLALLAYAWEWVLLNRLGLRQRTNAFQRSLEAEPMRRYLLLGLEMMLMPLAQALALQGSILMVGGLLGPTAVAIFGTHRTLARSSSSLLQLFSNPLRAEAGMLQRAEDGPTLARAVVALSRGTLWLSLVVALGLMAFGPWFFSIWTRHHIPFVAPLFLALLVGVVAEALWRVPASIPLGTNRHRPIAWGYLACSVAGLLISAPLGIVVGLPGVGIGASLIDVAMSVWATLMVSRMLGVTPGSYLRKLIVPPINEVGRLVNAVLSTGWGK